MSNSLADFGPDDVANRKKVVDKILSITQQWKYIRHELDTGQKHPDVQKAELNRLRQEANASTTGRSPAELRLEIQRVRVNMSKLRTKLDERPDHKKAAEWEAALERYTSEKAALEDELTSVLYET